MNFNKYKNKYRCTYKTVHHEMAHAQNAPTRNGPSSNRPKLKMAQAQNSPREKHTFTFPFFLLHCLLCPVFSKSNIWYDTAVRNVFFPFISAGNVIIGRGFSFFTPTNRKIRFNSSFHQCQLWSFDAVYVTPGFFLHCFSSRSHETSCIAVS